MIKKRLLGIMTASVMALSLFGTSAMAEEAAADTAAADTAAVSEDASSDTCISYLTGQTVPTSVGRRRPIAVMLSNVTDALPQYGISGASVVYEAQVEGLLTRLMGIFEDYDSIDSIGSVRSCRPYYVYYAREFNAIYAHYGQVVYAVPLLQLDSTANISGLPYGEDGQDYTLRDGSMAFYRTEDRESPHNVFTNASLLNDAIEANGYSTSYAEGYTGHYQFAAEGTEVNLDNGYIAKVVMPGYTTNHARFDYNEEEKVYYRSQYGDAHIDGATGEQLKYKNIIIQSCPSYMLDDHYYMHDPVNNGEAGTGWYITNGRAEKITWQKENWSADDPIETSVTTVKASWDVRECDFNVTHYYDESGNEITLNPGKTWVCIVRNDVEGEDNDAGNVLISDNPSVDSSVIDG